MFENYIDREKEELIEIISFPNEYVYMEEILQIDGLHPAYKQYFSAEADWWAFQERMVLQSHPNFDMRRPGMNEFLDEFVKKIRENARFDTQSLSIVISSAVKMRLNFLCRPRVALKWFVFRGETTRPVAELIRKVNYFYDYKYISRGIKSRIEKRKLADESNELFSLIEFERLIANVDNEHIYEMTPVEFINMLDPLIDFFDIDGDDGEKVIPMEALIIFLDDKGITPISRTLEKLLREDNIKYLTKSEFSNFILTMLEEIARGEKLNEMPCESLEQEKSEADDRDELEPEGAVEDEKPAESDDEADELEKTEEALPNEEDLAEEAGSESETEEEKVEADIPKISVDEKMPAEEKEAHEQETSDSVIIEDSDEYESYELPDLADVDVLSGEESRDSDEDTTVPEEKPDTEGKIKVGEEEKPETEEPEKARDKDKLVDDGSTKTQKEITAGQIEQKELDEETVEEPELKDFSDLVVDEDEIEEKASELSRAATAKPSSDDKENGQELIEQNEIFDEFLEESYKEEKIEESDPKKIDYEEIDKSEDEIDIDDSERNKEKEDDAIRQAGDENGFVAVDDSIGTDILESEFDTGKDDFVGDDAATSEEVKEEIDQGANQIESIGGKEEDLSVVKTEESYSQEDEKKQPENEEIETDFTEEHADRSADETKTSEESGLENGKKISELIGSKAEDRFIEKLFHKDMVKYFHFLNEIDRAQGWRDAAKMIDRMLIDNGVDPDSSAANDFRKAVQNKFTV